VRVVPDTNDLVSAVLSAHGTCARIVDMIADGALDLYADDRILAEYDSVLHRPELRIAPEDAGVILDLIRSITDTVAAIPLPVQLPDPDDAAFLEVAAASGSILITGNTRHFPTNARTGVSVMTPAEFLELLRGSRS
jgi:putative PIN family toxin of toxin-antitoxin system